MLQEMHLIVTSGSDFMLTSYHENHIEIHEESKLDDFWHVRPHLEGRRLKFEGDQLRLLKNFVFPAIQCKVWQRFDQDCIIERDLSKIELDDLNLSFILYIWQGSRRAFGHNSAPFTCIDLCASYNNDRIDRIGHLIERLFADFPRFVDEALEDQKQGDRYLDYEMFVIKPRTLRNRALNKTHEYRIADKEELERQEYLRLKRMFLYE